ncbi:MAG: hypothetical protein EOO51_13940 [Flavobacterium sp.]|nr:MAG: hypothetical protein EOO51_13940 [Flavobacterium sp.]
MNSIRLYSLALFLSIPILIIGALFKLLHWPGAAFIFPLAFLISIIYIIIGLTMIFRSNKPLPEKFLWLIGFIFFGLITGLLYYFIEIPKETKAIREKNTY